MIKVKKKVFVGLSGGVDSSVAALRLINQGYEVYGVFIKVWHPDWLKCNWEQERLDAMRVAAKLDIPFLTCDAEKAYKDGVADYFIEEYKKGLTPNPDVMCNKQVKFGAFLDFAKAHGADYVATGHYAQRLEKQGLNPCQFELHRGVDKNKDQTYFLWTLTQDRLAHVLFPVGDTPKDKIRQEAEEAGLLTAHKKDSQGICFLGHVDIADFLSHYINLETGNVLDETGHIIGRHHGALVYTNGQRHGFSIDTTDVKRQPHYVIDRNLEQNTITVSSAKPELPKTSTIELSDINLIVDEAEMLDTVEVQTRYRQSPIKAQVTHYGNNDLQLSPVEELESVSPGQSCVLYQGNKCLGGGIIT